MAERRIVWECERCGFTRERPVQDWLAYLVCPDCGASTRGRDAEVADEAPARGPEQLSFDGHLPPCPGELSVQRERSMAAQQAGSYRSRPDARVERLRLEYRRRFSFQLLQRLVARPASVLERDARFEIALDADALRVQPSGVTLARAELARVEVMQHRREYRVRARHRDFSTTDLGLRLSRALALWVGRELQRELTRGETLG